MRRMVHGMRWLLRYLLTDEVRPRVDSLCSCAGCRNLFYELASALQDLLYPHISLGFGFHGEEMYVILICILKERNLIDGLDSKGKWLRCLHLENARLWYNVRVEVREMAEQCLISLLQKARSASEQRILMEGCYIPSPIFQYTWHRCAPRYIASTTFRA